MAENTTINKFIGSSVRKPFTKSKSQCVWLQSESGYLSIISTMIRVFWRHLKLTYIVLLETLGHYEKCCNNTIISSVTPYVRLTTLYEKCYIWICADWMGAISISSLDTITFYIKEISLTQFSLKHFNLFWNNEQNFSFEL